jgi:hypothetical protein
MVIGEVIQRVQSLYSKGAQSDDSRLMSRHIYNKMLSTRSLLIFNKINKKQFMSKWNYTILPCVELIEVSGSDCPCIPAPGCKILRSKHPLPKPMNSISGYIIDVVMSIDGSTIFHEVTYIQKNWRSDDKYTSRKPDYFIKDDYLYITSTRKLKAVTVIGLFADPVEAENYPSYCDDKGEEVPECDSNPKDIAFPIDEEMIDALVEMTVRELSVGFALGNEDVRNDARDKDGKAPTRRQTQSGASQEQSSKTNNRTR